MIWLRGSSGQFPGLSQDASSPHRDGNTQCTAQEPGADALPQQRHNDSENYGESAAGHEKDMLLAFKEQEALSSAILTSLQSAASY